MPDGSPKHAPAPGADTGNAIARPSPPPSPPSAPTPTAPPPAHAAPPATGDPPSSHTAAPKAPFPALPGPAIGAAVLGSPMPSYQRDPTPATSRQRPPPLPWPPPKPPRTLASDTPAPPAHRPWSTCRQGPSGSTAVTLAVPPGSNQASCTPSTEPTPLPRPETKAIYRTFLTNSAQPSSTSHSARSPPGFASRATKRAHAIP